MVFDKRFYLEVGGRTDLSTFAALYGLTPFHARCLRDANLISAINEYASVKASKLRAATNLFHEKFQTMISAIQNELEDGENAALSPSGTTAIDRSYNAFLLALQTEVTDVGR